MEELRNILGPDELRKRIEAESFPRTTLSFYRYVRLNDPTELRNELFREWTALGVYGRIYLAHEGINAQLSVPTSNFKKFRSAIDARTEFAEVPFKIAVEDDGNSFLKLIIKVRPKLVADGLADDAFDTTDVGQHLDAEAFNRMLDEGATVVDMRNNYEAMIGHFEGALLPKSDTFRGAMEEMLEKLEDKKDEPVLLYCTGGIRCEKASAWFRHQGFTNVGQLHGGIIDYARQVKAQDMRSKYLGQNYVFDDRIAERITDDVVSRCMQCDAPSDRMNNCKQHSCNLMLIQCPACAIKFVDCCSPSCREIRVLPEEVQRAWRKGKPTTSSRTRAISDPEGLRRRIAEEEELLARNGALHPELSNVNEQEMKSA